MDEESKGWYFPSTCDNCEDRGYYVDGMFEPAEWVDEWHIKSKTTEPMWKMYVHVFPKRCNPCHARAERFRKANQTLKKLENIREMLHDRDMTGFEDDRWSFLKFVTLTWANEWMLEHPQLSKKELAAARLSIRRKRDKIATKLSCAGGTDVMENVVKVIYGCYPESDDYQKPYHKHHLHTHGIWVMPYHKSESILKVMKQHGIRDQCRAIRPVEVFSKRLQKWIVISGLAKARNYIMKYMTKEDGVKRGNWGLARGKLTEERFEEFLLGILVPRRPQ